MARDPLSVVQRNNLGALLFATERFNAALAEYRKVLELSPDGGWEHEFDVARVLVMLRRYDEAYLGLANLPAGERDYGLALLHEAPGRRAEADAAFARLSARSAGGDNIQLAEICAFRGRLDEAFAALASARGAIARNNGAARARTWEFQQQLRVSPFLNPLHSDPRWAALMADPP